MNETGDDFIFYLGVSPRTPTIVGIKHAKCVSYIDVLKGKVNVGKRVAIVGAGGIGFDVATKLLHSVDQSAKSVDAFLQEWGIDKTLTTRSGLLEHSIKSEPLRQIYLLQRTVGALGKGLGKTTGWIHRSTLKMNNVEMIGGVTYKMVDDQGLHIEVNIPLTLSVIL